MCAAASCESVFLRECKRCTFYLACKQLRTRDCEDCTIFLYTKTDPIIETSTRMSFGPFLGSCPRLSQAFRRANLDARHNHWRRVFDFNRGQADIPEPHWSILRTSCRASARSADGKGEGKKGFRSWAVSCAAETEWVPWSVPVDGLPEPENPVPLDAAPAPADDAAGAGGASIWGRGGGGGGGGGMMSFDIRTGQAAAEAALRARAEEEE
jgi:hypothetical protein